MTTQLFDLSENPSGRPDGSIGRIVSVTGSKAILLLDNTQDTRAARGPAMRPEMGTLLCIDTATTVCLAIVSALSVPVPAQREGDPELWIAELGLVGELPKAADGRPGSFNRGVTIYPSLGDRVRVAGKFELELAFCGDMRKSVRVGAIRQDASIPAMIKVDDLLGKHFAILGTTGTGKSCTTALILRSILEKNPAAHIVLLDPHNEYATAFKEWGEVVSPLNMHLPYWLLNFEEIVEVLIGDGQGRRAEVELLQELIPIAKGRYSTGRGKETPASLRRSQLDPGRFTVDTPVPYRISDLTTLLDERMGKLENKKDLAPYRNLKTRIETITQDGRYAFMFGSLTVYDGMAQVLSRLFRVPVNNKPITILELTGLPTEVVNVVVSVLCRMTFDFALWSEGQVPVTLVCEEAHRYVPANPNMGFEPCKRAIAKIAKEGRKYGASLCIVTQRPAEIDPTILSQCNTVFALRMSNDRDQEIVTSAISDTGSGLLEFLPVLGQREAIAFGDGVTLPVRIKFDELPRSALPRSSTAPFSERWQASVGDENFLESVVERWRASGVAQADASMQTQMLAEAMGIVPPEPAQQQQPAAAAHAGKPGEPKSLARMREQIEAAFQAPVADGVEDALSGHDRRVAAPAQAPERRTVAAAGGGMAAPGSERGSLVRRDAAPAAAPQGAAPARPGSALRRDMTAAQPAAQPQQAAAPANGAFRSLRERLLQKPATK